MQKRLSEILEYLDASRARLLESVAHVDSTFGEIRPREGVWSVAQILTHIASVDTSVANLVIRSVEWGKENGVGPETSSESVLSSLDSHSVAEGNLPLTAPERLVPPADSTMDGALKSLASSRQTLKDALATGDGMDMSTITRPHRVFGELNLYQWAIFAAQHEERHRRQIERTLRELAESTTESAPIC
jgi:uncharacterized damage-inducible protein DinB